MFSDMLKLSPVTPLIAVIIFFVSISPISTTPVSAAPEPSSGDGMSPKLAMNIETGKGQNAQSGDPLSGDSLQGPDAKTGSIISAPKAELVAGGIRAKLKLVGAGARFSAGSPAFAEITLTNISGAKQAGAEVVLETRLAKILDVSGPKVKVGNAGGQQIASVAGLRKGKPRKVTIELQLRGKDTGQSPQSDVTNSLKITLRPSGDSELSDSTVVTWPVSDCAGAFYSRIVSIRERNSDRMGKALKTAWRGSGRRPGRWLFRPPASASSSKRVCARWVKRWDYQRGRYRSRCTRYRTVRNQRVTGVKVTKEERAIFRFASKYVRTRAKDPQLSSRQHYGWVSQKVATDLRGYLKQNQHPAICSGAVEFADYFTDRMDEITKRAEVFAENSKKAHNLAAVKTAEVRELVKAEPGGHPGWGTAPLSMTFAGADRTLHQLIADLADLIGNDLLLADTEQANDAYAALKKMSGFASKGGLKPLAAETRKAILHALSLIEAADYIGAVHHHYSELDQSIVGSLTAMKKAHSEHCTCDR